MTTYTQAEREKMITELTVAAGLLSVGQVHDFDDLSETLACAANMLAAPSTSQPSSGEAVAWSLTVGGEFKNCVEITHIEADARGRYERISRGGFGGLYTLHELFDHPAPSPSLPLTDEQIDSLIAAAPREDCEKEGWIARQRRVWIRAAEAKIKGGE